ncbi:TSC22 domain family protein 2-like [Ixodes scapularis]|uniref:TSC22 domain family protein 2-like n=1 Tax=Ixodes scapularis TaxID=6945 RepID=UPI001C3800E7|nr:TSC22 domain family protein 2-like [Ixodes scapularis]
MADKICGDGIGNSTGRLYGAEVELITPNTMYGSSPGEPRTPVQPVDSGGPKKKPTSFQITSVTVQGSRLSNDGGDESADDLDESHTEDLSSDVLDVSKNADQLSPTDENGAADEPPAAAGAPTAGDASSGVPSLPPPTAATTVGAALTIVAGTPASAAPEVPVSPDHWQRRFKVVKIVSSEPFGRGRWLCMDFVDPPAMQGDAKPGDERESAAAGGADLPPAASNEAVAHVYEIPVGQTFPANSQQGGPLYGIILPVSSSAQGPPLGVLQPITEQPVVTDAPGPGEADPAEPVPENKSTAEEDSERWVPSRPPFAGADLCSEGLSVRRAQPRRCHAPTTALTLPRAFFLHVGYALALSSGSPFATKSAPLALSEARF